ncbi:hypothetical protein C6I20_02815 [Aeromicrobium sp. A1-2]|uniref:hypothetical protein n=1 Tax=Aeromicrobium sp. A1-2 TaxID=2107713 RepID=UPI000E4E08FE|nr:hypothetical protein [Aeromicrobium sp. A1-2]AXT84228.1 hypothetical protein C6I20_02815 [Aeromicrobium sp. A1-2]
MGRLRPDLYQNPILFLDDDAVVVERRRPGSKPLVDDLKFGTVTLGVEVLSEPLEIVYSKRAVEFLNVVADALFRVRWLTGLGEWVPEVFAPAVGLNQFASVPAHECERTADLHPSRTGQWFKEQLVDVTIAGSATQFVWVDDQLTSGTISRLASRFTASQHLAVPLDPSGPLTEVQFVKIAEFCGVSI